MLNDSQPVSISKQRKKVLFILLILFILIMATLGGFYFHNIQVQKSKEFIAEKKDKEKKEIESKYAVVLNKVVDNITVAKVQIEEMVNAYQNVWHDSIWDHEYTTSDGQIHFGDDFNLAIQDQQNVYKTDGSISKLQSYVINVDNTMKQLKDPPAKYKEIYQKIIDLYSSFRSFEGLAENPSGSLSDYTSNINTIGNDLSQKLAAINVQLPDVRKFSSIKKTSENAKSNIAKTIPIFNQTELDKIYYGWELVKTETIHFQNKDVIVAGISKEEDSTSRVGKVIVVQFDSSIRKWLTKWADEILSKNEDVLFYEYQSIIVTKSSSQKQALALVTADVGGSTGYGQALILTIGADGKSELKGKFDINAMSSKQQGNTIILSGDQQFGTHKLSFEAEKYVDYKIPSSELTSDNATNVSFKLNGDGNIHPTQQNTFNMKVGQTIAFVPSDALTKEKFDQGTIEIYTDAWNDSFNTSNANRLWSGNSYTFEKIGTVHFLLITDEKNAATLDIPTPTFTVNVQP